MVSQADYRSFLIRLYRQKNGVEAWRISLENVQTGERLGFASLQALYEYLNQAIETEPETGKGTSGEKARDSPP